MNHSRLASHVGKRAVQFASGLAICGMRLFVEYRMLPRNQATPFFLDMSPKLSSAAESTPLNPVLLLLSLLRIASDFQMESLRRRFAMRLSWPSPLM